MQCHSSTKSLNYDAQSDADTVRGAAIRRKAMISEGTHSRHGRLQRQVWMRLI